LERKEKLIMNFVEQYEDLKKKLYTIHRLMQKIKVGDVLNFNAFYDGTFLKVYVTKIINERNGDFDGYFVRTDGKIDAIKSFNILSGFVIE
jgi:hypothetical protein